MRQARQIDPSSRFQCQLLGLAMLETLLVRVDPWGLDQSSIDQLLALTGLPLSRCLPGSC
jgi:hypothetical protein